MKNFKRYLSEYFVSLNPFVFFASVLFIALAIFTNYHFGINDRINDLYPASGMLCWWGIFFAAFGFGYVLLKLVKKEKFKTGRVFFILLLIAPLLFAIKMAFPLHLHLVTNEAKNAYWNAVVYFPLKLVLLLTSLWITWKLSRDNQPFYGTSIRGFNIVPYLGMLAVMIPLITLASFQHDFQLMYPKLMHLSYFHEGNGTAWEKLLYELSYGTDFISIEFFFRGFLVLAFVKWAGQDAILPMALFYCTIHFGKPLGECISSFFGGLILGVITYHTRTIFGGLIVHLGIAWMMELGGYLAQW
jgi:hypothetical protein